MWVFQSPTHDRFSQRTRMIRPRTFMRSQLLFAVNWAPISVRKSCQNFAKALRARDKLDITVPAGTPLISAISLLRHPIERAKNEHFPKIRRELLPPLSHQLSFWSTTSSGSGAQESGEGGFPSDSVASYSGRFAFNQV